MTTGQQLIALLDEFREKHPEKLTIVETGSMRSTSPGAEEGDGWSTMEFAKWIKAHPGSIFFTMDLDPKLAEAEIKKAGLDSYDLNFYTGESVGLLQMFNFGIDFAYLDTSDDLQHGLEEFKLCEAKGAKRIVMDDRLTKCLSAMEYALNSQRWTVRFAGRFTVMDRHA